MNGYRRCGVHIYIHAYNGIQRSHKKDEKLLFVIWIDHEGIMLSAIHQMKKDKFCMASFICGISKLINKQIKQMTKPNHTPRHREQSSHCWRDRGDKEDKIGEEDQLYVTGRN